VFAVLCSCKQHQVTSYPDKIFDTEIPEGDILNKMIFSIPSPHQISLLIKDDYPDYEESIFQKRIDLNHYSTSEKRALVLGALCVDVGYLSLYDQKELTIQYLDNIKSIISTSRHSNPNTSATFKRINNNLNNSDSILTIISEITRQENEAAQEGEMSYLGPLIVAGGWIESFYILNTLYNNSKNSNLFGIILQQQCVLENLIQILRPYYKKSSEYTDVMNRLVEIAYEFDVVDVSYKNVAPTNSENVTTIKCRFTPLLSGSQLDKINELSGSLRKHLIF
jgi:hypothetical protein